jgi:hypothetical protein
LCKEHKKGKINRQENEARELENKSSPGEDPPRHHHPREAKKTD